MTSFMMAFLKSYLKNLSIFASHSLFFKKKNRGASLIIFLELPPSWSCPQVFYHVLFFWVFSRMISCGRGFTYSHRGCFHSKIFGNSKLFPNTKAILMLVWSKFVPKRIQMILIDRVSWELKNFVYQWKCEVAFYFLF
jgi:hypothetical protein